MINRGLSKISPYPARNNIKYTFQIVWIILLGNNVNKIGNHILHILIRKTGV